MRELLALGLVNWIVTLILVEGVIFNDARDEICRRFPGRVAYFVTCHLCAGTWVGLILGFFGGPFGDWHWFILNGLAIKAIGHVTLEVTSLLAALTRRVKL